MRVTLPLIAAFGAGLLSTSATFAHHAVQATVDIDKNVEVVATLIKVDWINPHAWMHFDMTMPDGSVVNDVKVESLAMTALHQAGLDSNSLLLGDGYDVTFYPNRDGSAGGFMTRMVLPDGRIFDIQNRGKVVGPDGP